MAKKRTTNKSTQQRTPKCKAPGCTRVQIRRGMCDSCYRAARRLVLAGKTSWEELEAKGIASPPKKPGRRPTPVFEAITKGTSNKTKSNKKRSSKT